eukprot:10495350-Ditylum_brightwellii.AAC.1
MRSSASSPVGSNLNSGAANGRTPGQAPSNNLNNNTSWQQMNSNNNAKANQLQCFCSGVSMGSMVRCSPNGANLTEIWELEASRSVSVVSESSQLTNMAWDYNA